MHRIMNLKKKKKKNDNNNNNNNLNFFTCLNSLNKGKLFC